MAAEQRHIFPHEQLLADQAELVQRIDRGGAWLIQRLGASTVSERRLYATDEEFRDATDLYNRLAGQLSTVSEQLQQYRA